MKKCKTLFSAGLVLFALCCLTLFSCQKEQLLKSDIDQTIATMAKKKGNGGGNPAPIYSATYDGAYDSEEGDLFTSGPGYYKKTKDSPKVSILGENCGDQVMNTGLNEAFEILLQTGCYDGPICGDTREIRQYDKKKLEQNVAVHFWFVDPDNGSNVHLVMHGFIDANSEGEYSIYPLSSSEDVTLRLDRWRILGLNPSCGVDDAVTFASMELPDQKMTIKLLETTDCPSNFSCFD